MNPNQISPDDPRLTLYALGEMEAHEQAGFEKLLAQDPAAREVVAEIRAMAGTVTAALEQEPMEAAPVKSVGKVLRFPQAYFAISGLAAACFAVFFVIWKNAQKLKQQTDLVEIPMTASKEAKDKGCRTLEGAPITVIQSIKPRPGAPVPAVSRGEGSKVDANEQRARDTDARRILESELKKEEEQLAGLQKEYNNGEPERRGDEKNYQKYQDRVSEMKASIARKESDIAALRRELGKQPQSTPSKLQ